MQKVRVRLRRRRTVSGSLTPNTPVRASTFVYTNGFSKHSLTNALHSSGEHEGGASTEGAHRGGTKERGSRESSDEKKAGGDLMTEKRLQRFERSSFRLRDYKRPMVGQMSPISLRSERTTGTDSSKDVRLNSREAAAVGDSDSYSSPEMSPAHSRSKSDEIPNECGGKLHPERHSLLLPSEASQRLLLTSSSSALTVSSSASSHSLQQSTFTATSAHTATVPASERDPSQAGLPSLAGAEESKNPTPGSKAIDEIPADARQVDARPKEKGQLEGPDLSASQLQPGASMHASRVSPKTHDSLIDQEHALKESGGDVFLPMKERKQLQDHPRMRNPPKVEGDSSTPTPKEKTARIRRRHTVQYPRDLGKYRKG